MARPITLPAGPTPARRDIVILSGEETVISRADEIGPLILTVSETSSGAWIERLTGDTAVSVADQPGIAAMIEGREYHYNLWRDNGADRPDLLAKGRVVREGTIEPGVTVEPPPSPNLITADSTAVTIDSTAITIDQGVVLAPATTADSTAVTADSSTITADEAA